MTPLTTPRAVAAAIEFVPALLFWVWAFIGRRGMRERFPSLPWFVFHPAALMAVHYLLSAVFALLPPEMHGHPPLLLIAAYLLCDMSLIVSLAAFRHLIEVFSLGGTVSAGWKIRNYGAAVATCVLAAFFPVLLPLSTFNRQLVAYKILMTIYCLSVAVLMARRLRQVARPGAWRAGGVGGPRRRDVLLYGSGIVLGAVGMALVLLGRGVVVWPAIHAGMGLAFLVPTIVIVLGTVVRAVLLAVALLTVTTVAWWTLSAAALHTDPALRPVLDVAAVLVLMLVLVPGQAALRIAIDRLVFRRRQQRWNEVQAFVHGLSPELGIEECCRRVLGELARVLRLRGGAIVLRDGRAVTQGQFVVAPLAALWPSVVDELPGRMVAGMLSLPPAVRQAFEATDTLGAFLIASPRQRWGHVFITTSLLGAVFTDEDLGASRLLADQLALVLDAADLLARAVAVERSLAHAEKLAAVGETAARIAHEIRNPVTAARSLAQQLCREPTPFHEEHALILAELERVERQVAALLRFSRKEEFRLEPVDLGELVGATVESYRGRCAEHAIALGVDAPAGVVVRADREKLRQVLVNLIDNALDALAGTDGDRRLALSVGGEDGHATVCVRDSGPGVPPEALPRLFEPFFSLKGSGTGLGLAIARRTLAAHGGRIDALPEEGGGMTFRLALPRG